MTRFPPFPHCCAYDCCIHHCECLGLVPETPEEVTAYIENIRQLENEIKELVDVYEKETGRMVCSINVYRGGAVGLSDDIGSIIFIHTENKI